MEIRERRQSPFTLSLLSASPQSQMQFIILGMPPGEQLKEAPATLSSSDEDKPFPTKAAEPGFFLPYLVSTRV